MKKIFKKDQMFLELFKISMLNSNISRAKKKLQEKKYIYNPEKSIRIFSYIHISIH